jgi:hypothetical protein
MILKALPKSDGTNDIGSGIAELEVRVKRLSW